MDNKDLDYRKIKNYLRKHSSTSIDDYNLRLSLLKLFYYDIDNIPIAILKLDADIYYDFPFPNYFKNKDRFEIIDIYNKEVKTKSLIKILNRSDFNNYEIIENNFLDISLKTFRPVYNKNWKIISEYVNNVSFSKQKSFYADYLRCYLKLKKFPSFNEYIKFIYDKYNTPVHKDIHIVFDNIQGSYKNVFNYINTNNLTFQQIRNIIIQSTPISNRIKMQNSF